MLEVTADTNIFVSGFIFAGVPRQFVDAAEEGRIRLAISDALLNELSRILAEKFGWTPQEIAEPVALLTGCTVRVHPTMTIDAVPEDPDDNRVLECAVEAKSQFIVTGDNALLRLGGYEGIRIVRVADFMRLIDSA